MAPGKGAEVEDHGRWSGRTLSDQRPASQMDIYSRTVEMLGGSITVRAWPEMQALLERAAIRKPTTWKLPVLTCDAVGGAVEQALPASAAVACLHLSLKLIDDLLDADPRGAHSALGLSGAANLALAFQAVALDVVAGQPAAEPATRLAVLCSLNRAAATTAFGQHLDAQPVADEAAYWHVVETKSAPFFAAAMQVGALQGGASEATADQLRRFGHLYGEMIQIHDDLSDTLAVPADPDWTTGRSPLPILFAQLVAHPERERFLELRRAIPDPAALTEAQSILIRCGAVSYGIHQLFFRYQAAQDVLRAVSLVRRAGLEALLQNLIRPVHELLRAIGATWPGAVEAIGQDSDTEALIGGLDYSPL